MIDSKIESNPIKSQEIQMSSQAQSQKSMENITKKVVKVDPTTTKTKIQPEFSKTIQSRLSSYTNLNSSKAKEVKSVKENIESIIQGKALKYLDR